MADYNPSESNRKSEDKLPYLTIAEFLAGPELRPLIAGVLDLDSMAMLHGRPGATKSYVALDMALHIAHSIPWHGHRVHGGNVFYVLAEGQSGTRLRLRAWHQYHDLDPYVEDRVRITDRAYNLLDEKDWLQIIAMVREHQPVLTVIDTLTRHAPGLRENDPDSMSLMTERLGLIQLESGGGTVLPLHHPSQGNPDRGRGHGSLEAALDTSIQVTKKRPSGKSITVLKHTKRRDGEIKDSIIKFGHQTIHVNPPPDPDVPLPMVLTFDASSSNEELILAVLTDADDWISFRDLRSASEVAEGSFGRVLRKLVEKGEVEKNDRNGYRLSDA